MIQRLSIDELYYAMDPGSLYKGKYIAELGKEDWVGLDTTGDKAVIFRGSFREVIETFVPYNGLTESVPCTIQGVRRTRDTIEWVDMKERRRGKRRNGVNRKAQLRETA